MSDYIGTKTAKQVEEHYWDEYHGRNGYCLPPTMLWNGETIPTEKYIEDVVPASERETLRGYYTGSLVETYPLGEEAGRDKIKEGSRGKDKQEIQQRNLALPGGDLPGYLPLREDFDVEYDNDAENILADLEFADDDHPSEKELKLQIVQIYNKKLEERNLRKRFAIDCGIVDYKKFQLVWK